MKMWPRMGAAGFSLLVFLSLTLGGAVDRRSRDRLVDPEVIPQSVTSNSLTLTWPNLNTFQGRRNTVERWQVEKRLVISGSVWEVAGSVIESEARSGQFEIQTITTRVAHVSNSVSQGRFRLSLQYKGVHDLDLETASTTAELEWDASAVDVKAQLESLAKISLVDVNRAGPLSHGGFAWTVTFREPHTPDLPLLSVAEATNFDSGASVVVNRQRAGTETQVLCGTRCEVGVSGLASHTAYMLRVRAVFDESSDLVSNAVRAQTSRRLGRDFRRLETPLFHSIQGSRVVLRIGIERALPVDLEVQIQLVSQPELEWVAASCEQPLHHTVVCTGLEMLTKYRFRVRAPSQSMEWSSPSEVVETAGQGDVLGSLQVGQVVELVGHSDASLQRGADRLPLSWSSHNLEIDGLEVVFFEVEQREPSGVARFWSPAANGKISPLGDETKRKFVPEVQTVSTRRLAFRDASPITEGRFRLGFRTTQVTGQIAFDASADDVRKALEALDSIGQDGVLGVERSGVNSQGGFDWKVTFSTEKRQDLRGDLPNLMVASQLLENGAAHVVVAQNRAGSVLERANHEVRWSATGLLPATDYEFRVRASFNFLDSERVRHSGKTAWSAASDMMQTDALDKALLKEGSDLALDLDQPAVFLLNISHHSAELGWTGFAQQHPGNVWFQVEVAEGEFSEDFRRSGVPTSAHTQTVFELSADMTYRFRVVATRRSGQAVYRELHAPLDVSPPLSVHTLPGLFNSWHLRRAKKGRSRPSRRAGHQFAPLLGHLYSFGGFGEGWVCEQNDVHCEEGYTPLNDLWRYDFNASDWLEIQPKTETADWPSPRSHAALLSHRNGKLYLFGGTQKPSVLHEWSLEPAQRTQTVRGGALAEQKYDSNGRLECFTLGDDMSQSVTVDRDRNAFGEDLNLTKTPVLGDLWEYDPGQVRTTVFTEDVSSEKPFTEGTNLLAHLTVDTAQVYGQNSPKMCVQQAKVKVSLTHESCLDDNLEIFLVLPSQHEVHLFKGNKKNRCGTGTSLNSFEFTDFSAFEQITPRLHGLRADGRYSLRVIDLNLDGNAGALQSWELELTTFPCDKNGEWRKIVPLLGQTPPDRYNAHILPFKNYIFLFGGQGWDPLTGKHTSLNDLWRFDTVNLVWKELNLSPFHNDLSNGASLTLSPFGMIKHAGYDTRNRRMTSETHFLDLFSNKWKKLPTTGRRATSSVKFNAHHKEKPLPQLWEDLPESRAFHAAALVNFRPQFSAIKPNGLPSHAPKLVVFGGFDGLDVLGDVWDLDLSKLFSDRSPLQTYYEMHCKWREGGHIREEFHESCGGDLFQAKDCSLELLFKEAWCEKYL